MNETASENSQYTVVARRYRPQSFEDLVGQGHISQALTNAIRQNRVGHAYLFTGARGVGKTSSARIFAKCLNCETGPTDTPCNQCDICQTVSIGEDVDVLEIDGASNRGIDEIRQLRSNANVRPSRSRFKIYIIDEVHMLTQQAFNALLKTLEEPPEHVKFIFCTTDPQKIPITVLSRCQRFDFSPVQTGEITQRLQKICTDEGIQADPEALALLARRAGGSMRDSQSLLEQLFSFCDTELSVEQVHQLLGTADMSRIAALATAMSAHDAASAMNQINEAINGGVDAGQLAEQTLGYFRDMMAVRVGSNAETLLHCGQSELEALNEQAGLLGLETILSIVQILDQAVVRMQSSMHTRTLLEVAAIRICQLEHLDLLVDIANQVGHGAATTGSATKPKFSSAQKTTAKKNEIADVSNTSAPGPNSAEKSIVAESSSSEPLNTSNAANSDEPDATQPPSPPETEPTTSDAPKSLRQDQMETIWRDVVSSFEDMTADMAAEFRKLELTSADRLQVTLADKYRSDMCNRPDRKQKLEEAFFDSTGVRIRIDFVADPDQSATPPQPVLTRVQQIKKLEQDPFVKSAIELFEAEVVDFKRPKAND